MAGRWTFFAVLSTTACSAHDARVARAPLSYDGGRLEQVTNEVYVDEAAPPEDRARLTRDFELAMRRIDEVLGQLDVDTPTVIFCAIDACRVHFTGPARRSWTLSPGDRAPLAKWSAGDRPAIVIVRTDASARAHLIHELVHVAVGFGRRGLRGRPFGSVPLWFHEGLATSIAGAPDCTAPGKRGIDDLRRLDSNHAWAEHTSHAELLTPTYCQARAEVDAWIALHGRARLFELLDAVRGGASFYDLYGPMVVDAMH